MQGQPKASMYLDLCVRRPDKFMYQDPLPRQIADNCAGFNGAFLNFAKTPP